MVKVAKEHLLTAAQMAQFVTDGYLVLNEVVPQHLNETVHKELKEFEGSGRKYWMESETIRQVFDLPQVKGALQSLLGEKQVSDHAALHKVVPMHYEGQTYHADSIIDTRPFAFDVQAFYFCHDAPDEMGPTLVLPGSHLRRVNTASIGRYKNIAGQRRLACKAGTIAFMHHGIWHCAQPNSTDTMRYMFKLRLRPGQQQRNLFNTDGCDDPDVKAILYGGSKPWQGNESRLDHMNRAKLWRYVVGNDSVDVSFEGAFSRMGI
ncbi:MAG: hypothetical protein JWN30_981 [Bacilli bacterium]|nr:hypothetical protein [Bacilli bacterium]